MEAAAIAATMTSDPAVIVAAVLHDVLEDTDCTADDVCRLFGQDVLALIEGDSEDKRADRPAAETWEVRKQETVDYVKNRATVREKMIVLADKLSNLRAIYRDLSAMGPALWERFNQKDPAKHKWYYTAVIGACAELADTDAYREAVDLIENKIDWTQKRFPGFQKLIDTMRANGFDYKKDYLFLLNNVNRRARGETFALSEHVSGMVFSQLSNQRPWKGIAQNAKRIKRIFCDFDAEAILAMSPEQLNRILRDLLAIQCGNRQIAKQIGALQDNIRTLKAIAAEHGSIDAYYNKTPTEQVIRSLASGPYKLKQMGVPLVSEYLRNVGMDIIKPDTHVKRILGRLGYTASNPATDEEAMRVCAEIAVVYGMRNIEVDAVLWQYCADGYFEKCTDVPDCRGCLAYPCRRCPKQADA